MEIKMLKDNSIWIRSEDNEIYLVGCNSDGDLFAERTQPRLKPSDNNDLIKVCPLCKDELQKIDGVALSFNGLCKDCAKATYIVWRDCVGDGDKPIIKS